MEGMKRPRGECPVVKLARESREGWGAIAPLPPLAAGAGGQAVTGLLDKKNADAVGAGEGEGGEDGEEERLKFGIILMCDEGMWPPE